MTTTGLPTGHPSEDTSLAVGLLAHFPALYDRALPDLRGTVRGFRDEVVEAMHGEGLRVVSSPICTVRDEYAAAVKEFEDAGADAIVSLHLAYAPSLESEEVLAATDLPLVIVQTTPSNRFDETVSPDDMLSNHGIHGVQDLCNRLLRRGKDYDIHAGAFDGSDVIARVRQSVQGARISRELAGARVGLVGAPFDGMGDIHVDIDQLHDDLGITVVRSAGGLPVEVDPQLVGNEMAADLARFERGSTHQDESHRVSTVAGLRLRQWVSDQELSALTVNVMAAGIEPGLDAMPFLECSKAMERGLGYAGEGDVLTAAWVGALLQVFPETTFTEMFCPDWAGDAVFLSHMGEFNYRVADGTPRLETLPFPYTDAPDPVVAYGSLGPGRGALANLSYCGSVGYRLTMVPGRVRQVRAENELDTLLNGWFVPDCGVARLLEEFSRLGGTHHNALIRSDEDVRVAMASVARLSGLELRTITP